MVKADQAPVMPLRGMKISRQAGIPAWGNTLDGHKAVGLVFPARHPSRLSGSVPAITREEASPLIGGT